MRVAYNRIVFAREVRMRELMLDLPLEALVPEDCIGRVVDSGEGTLLGASRSEPLLRDSVVPHFVQDFAYFG